MMHLLMKGLHSFNRQILVYNTILQKIISKSAGLLFRKLWKQLSDVIEVFFTVESNNETRCYSLLSTTLALNVQIKKFYSNE